MEGTYATFLQMKTILKELPKEFYSKLSQGEKEKVNELALAVESLKPSYATRVVRRKNYENEGGFQPKNIIFCLNMKKVFTSKRFKFLRFAFALIRCLTKDEIRSERKKHRKSQSLLPMEDLVKDNNDDIVTVKMLKESKKKMLITICKVYLKNKSQILKSKTFFNWTKQYLTYAHLRRNFITIAKSLLKKRFSSILIKITLHPKAAPGKSFQNLFFFLLHKRKALIFSKLFRTCQKCSQKKPHLTIEFCEFIPKYNIIETKLSEKSKNTISKSNPKNPKQTPYDETENFEDFERSPKKNTKMIKKKKTLLRGSKAEVMKINSISKNHSWVEAFALMKWKKFYFSTTSPLQGKGSIGVLVSQILNEFAEKYQKNMKSVFFENLKVRLLVKKQKNFKICVLVNVICGIEKGRNKVRMMKAFQILMGYLGEREEKIEEFYGRMDQIEELQRKGYGVFVILKDFLEHFQLKQKIISFVAIQSCEFSECKDYFSLGLLRLSATLQKLIYIKKYIHFYELKDQVYIKVQKLNFFTEIIGNSLQNAKIRSTISAFLKIKAYSNGRVQCLSDALSKFLNYSHKRYAFLMINSYTIHLANFQFLREMFTSNLLQKIYFKRLSFSTM